MLLLEENKAYFQEKRVNGTDFNLIKNTSQFMASYLLDGGVLLVSVSYFSPIFEIYVLHTKGQWLKGSERYFPQNLAWKGRKKGKKKDNIREKEFAWYTDSGDRRKVCWLEEGAYSGDGGDRWVCIVSGMGWKYVGGQESSFQSVFSDSPPHVTVNPEMYGRVQLLSRVEQWCTRT